MGKLQGHSRMIGVAVIAADALLAGLIFHLFVFTCKGTGWEKALNVPETQIIMTLTLCSLLCSVKGTAVMYHREAYAYQIIGTAFKSVASFAILAGVSLAAGQFMDVWSYLFAGYIIGLFICVLAFRLLLRLAIKRSRLQGKNVQYAILVGGTESNTLLYNELSEQQWARYKVEGYFDGSPNLQFSEECAYLGTLDKVIGFLRRTPRIECLFCCLPPERKDTIREIIDYCENHLIRFYNVPYVYGYLLNQTNFRMIGQVPCLGLRKEPLNRVRNKLLKRGFDIAFSVVFLCTVFPIVLLVVAIVTECTMPGPIFFVQKRNGLNDKVFKCYKFRSMRVNGDSDRLQATRDDPRITRWGHILRKLNIDEMPQFINVLLGDMSIVGPRPHMIKHTEEYSKLISKYMVRHFVKPGITGWSQINGFRGETKKLVDMQNRIKYDIWYIEHWTFALDLYIIYRTIVNFLRGEDQAY